MKHESRRFSGGRSQFFVVLPMNKLNERLKATDKPAIAEPSNEEKLLAEIRDELKARRTT